MHKHHYEIKGVNTHGNDKSYSRSSQMTQRSLIKEDIKGSTSLPYTNKIFPAGWPTSTNCQKESASRECFAYRFINVDNNPKWMLRELTNLSIFLDVCVSGGTLEGPAFIKKKQAIDSWQGKTGNIARKVEDICWHKILKHNPIF